MTYAFLIASVFLFMLAIKVFRIVPEVQEIIGASRSAVAVMRSQDLAEEEKEEQVQKAAIKMFASSFFIVIRIAATVAVPVVFVAVPTYFGLFTGEEVYAAASNWIFIIVSSVVMIGLFFVLK
jgi:hypothetical protein